MKALRRELNALALDTQRIGGTLDTTTHRELLRAHLVRLRESANLHFAVAYTCRSGQPEG